MDTRALGAEFFTKGRNPHGRNENRNTIYGSDPALSSEARAAAHSRTERKEAREGLVSDIDRMFGIYVNGASAESV